MASTVTLHRVLLMVALIGGLAALGIAGVASAEIAPTQYGAEQIQPAAADSPDPSPAELAVHTLDATLFDPTERRVGTAATGDTDGDGLSDRTELRESTDPVAADSDGDGLTDGAEVYGRETDPLAADSDGDLLDDAAEIELGTDPLAWLSPVTVPGLLGGFLLGTLLSGGVALALWRLRPSHRARSLLDTGAVPFAGEREPRGGDPPSEPSAQSTVADRHEAEFAADPDVADAELIPDDLRVRALLERERGRMRQSAIVEVTEWSKSKVSRLLSRMADEGAVIKIPLGRENLVCLPGHEPSFAKRRPA